jgi:hypothetical protein
LPPIEFNCPLGDDCDEGFKGKNDGDQRRHLKRLHDMTEEDALEMVPLSKAEETSKKNRELKGPKPKPPSWECPAGTCVLKSTLRTAEERRQHLVKAHSWTREKALESIPVTLRERNARAKKLEGQIQEVNEDGDE